MLDVSQEELEFYFVDTYERVERILSVRRYGPMMNIYDIMKALGYFPYGPEHPGQLVAIKRAIDKLVDQNLLYVHQSTEKGTSYAWRL